jgi:hypothetical protein
MLLSVQNSLDEGINILSQKKKEKVEGGKKERKQ